MSETKRTNRIKAYAGFIKLEHAVFSLPLVFAGALLHTGRWPSWRLSGLILLAAIGGRFMAMGLNRIIDAKIDARNPRTQDRELPSGIMRHGEAWFLVAAAGVLYLSAAATISPICVWLSPIPVALFVLYPYMKRFTTLSHLGLGLAWSMAPVGGWLAASGSLERMGEIGWLWLFSVLWVAGLDVIYATMDEGFDRKAGLHSMPARMGKHKALMAATKIHALALFCMTVLWARQLVPGWSTVFLVATAVLFFWQHAIAHRNPAFAFFKLNGVLGFVVFGLVAAGV